MLLLRSAKAPLRGKALGCGDLGAGAGRSRSQRQMPLGSSWAVGFQSRLTAEPEDWNGTLEPWNPGTPELRNDASSCIIMIHHDPSSIVIITGHVVRESFIFEAHIVLCWVLLFMNCQPRIESVPSSQKYHSVVFVRMEVKAGRKWQKAYLTLLSWRMCGDQFMSLHNWENVERC